MVTVYGKDHLQQRVREPPENDRALLPPCEREPRIAAVSDVGALPDGRRLQGRFNKLVLHISVFIQSMFQCEVFGIYVEY